MKKKFNWKDKSAIFIGRFQPFHEGHKRVFLNALKKNKQVTILVMDSFGINKKNPYKFLYVKIPVVSEVVYGRTVGYNFRKIKLSKSIEKISATKIRKKILKK